MSTVQKQIFELVSEEDQSALTLLQSTGLSTATLKHAGQQGSIWARVGNNKIKRIRRLKKKLQAGVTVWLYYDPDILAAEVSPATLVIDKTDYSLWFKPRGMFSQPTKWGDANSIARFVELTLNRPTYLVHRLDRMTAGLMILCHKRSLVRDFTTAFTDHAIRKCYRAVVKGKLPEEHMTITEPIDDKAAQSDVYALQYDPSEDLSLCQVDIKSGKKHQIRRHLAHINHAIVGDRLYGQKDDTHDLQLLATALEFTCPVSGEPIQVQLSHDLQRKLLLLSST